MPGQFISPEGDLETMFVSDYAIIDQFAKTGSLWMWGSGGALGNNTTTTVSSPVQTISGGTNWKLVSTNYYGGPNTVAIKTDGTLWGWGLNNSYGQLGDNTIAAKSSPVQTIASGTNWLQASSGGHTTGAVKTDGTLWLWGKGIYGNLGDNTVVSKSSPVQTIASGNNWKQVSVSATNTGAIKIDGTLWLWGYNVRGGVGDNTASSRSSPVQTVSGGTNWKQVSLGGFPLNDFTSATKTDGTLWTWGVNRFGQLGDNTTVNKSSPIQTIAGGTNWQQVSCGNSHTGAIKTDGTLWTWGLNTDGQLGDNTIALKSSPVQTVAGGTNWKQVSAGEAFTAAIKTDGTLWTWGRNGQTFPFVLVRGTLGDNTAVNKSSPVQTAAGGTNWKQVSTGNAGGAIYFYDAFNLYPSA